MKFILEVRILLFGSPKLHPVIKKRNKTKNTTKQNKNQTRSQYLSRLFIQEKCTLPPRHALINTDLQDKTCHLLKAKT